MKKLFKSTLAIVLVLTLLSSFSICFAAETTKKYHDYGSYVLLGDSIACGWSDVEQINTSFKDVEYSYGHKVADALGVTYHPMAGIAFRTTELRYIFEDDYEGDQYLFYSVDKDDVDRRIPEIRKAVSEAGLVSLNVGGNDWGSYLGWTLFDLMDESEVKNEKFLTEARKYLEEAGTARDTVDNLIDIATVAGCIDQLVQVMPQALNRGITTYFTNWNIVIDDIYALNPDVTIVVVGMFDTAVQDPEISDDSSSDEGFDIQNAATKIEVGQMIVDIANIPMKAGAEKYGYIYVEPVGTYCELQHPSRNGHTQIAEAILAALPDAGFPYTDVDLNSEEYTAIEYMWLNNIIEGVTETEFAPNKALTKGDLENALAKLAGEEATSTDDAKAKRIDVIKAVMNADEDATFMTKLKAFAYAVSCFINNFKFNFLSEITRAEAAVILYDYINL